MTAFRNTGIEGSYGSMATQNWILARRREQQRFSKVTGEKTVSWHHSTRKGPGPAVKTAPIKGVNKLWVPVLLQYHDGPFIPAKHGPSGTNRSLLKNGLIQCVEPPERVAHETYAGDTYLITKLGREYVAYLRAKA